MTDLGLLDANIDVGFFVSSSIVYYVNQIDRAVDVPNNFSLAKNEMIFRKLNAPADFDSLVKAASSYMEIKSRSITDYENMIKSMFAFSKDGVFDIILTPHEDNTGMFDFLKEIKDSDIEKKMEEIKKEIEEKIMNASGSEDEQKEVEHIVSVA